MGQGHGDGHLVPLASLYLAIGPLLPLSRHVLHIGEPQAQLAGKKPAGSLFQLIAEVGVLSVQVLYSLLWRTRLGLASLSHWLKHLLCLK